MQVPSWEAWISKSVCNGLGSAIDCRWSAHTSGSCHLGNLSERASINMQRALSTEGDNFGRTGGETQAVGCFCRRACRRLDLPLPDIPDPMLRCDLALTFDLRIGAEQQKILLQALREYERIWINRMSPATALRTEVRSLFGKYLEKDIPLREVDWHWNDSDGLRGANHPRVLFRLQELEKEITREHDEVVLGRASSQQDDLPTAPVACFYAGMFEGFRLVVRGLGEDPARSFARHATLLDLGELQEWLTRHLQDLAQRHAIRIAQLCVPFERNPNVLASPDFGALRVELWDLNAGALSLNGAKFVLDPVSRMPFLTLPTNAEPMAVFCFASADIGASDPISRQLLWTAFQDTPEPNLAVSAVTLQCERDVPSFAPRMCLPGGGFYHTQDGPRWRSIDRPCPIARIATLCRMATTRRVLPVARVAFHPT